MVAALSLYEDWVPFAAAVALVLVQQGITAAIVDYDRADSPWVWALVHSAFIGALSVVCLATWRASEHDREAFRSLVESLEEGVLMVDASGRLVTANPSVERILGVEPASLLVESGTDPEWLFVSIDGKPLPEDQRPLRVTATTGRPQIAVPLGLRRADGTTRWLSVSTRAVETDREPPYAVVLSFSDVTDERAPSTRSRAPTRISGSSPTSRRTTSPSRCGWSRATSICCAVATTGVWIPTPTSSSSTRSTAPAACAR